jgi:hypothetical protein
MEALEMILAGVQDADNLMIFVGALLGFAVLGSVAANFTKTDADNKFFARLLEAVKRLSVTKKK